MKGALGGDNTGPEMTDLDVFDCTLDENLHWVKEHDDPLSARDHSSWQCVIILSLQQVSPQRISNGI